MEKEKEKKNQYRGKIDNTIPIEMTINNICIIIKDQSNDNINSDISDINYIEDTVINYKNIVTFATNAKECFLFISYSDSNEENDESTSVKIHFDSSLQCTYYIY